MVGLEHEVGIGPADIDAYARHESPARSSLAPPCQSRVHNAFVILISRETLSAMSRPCNPRRQTRDVGARPLQRLVSGAR
jgi:hypothetical protein